MPVTAYLNVQAPAWGASRASNATLWFMCSTVAERDGIVGVIEGDVAWTEDVNRRYIYQSGVWVLWAADAVAVWGGMFGTMSNQTDLQDALDAKLDSPLPAATTAARGGTKVDHDSAGNPVALTAAGHALDADPHSQYALDTEKGAASGLATLDGSTKLTAAQLPLGSSSTTAAAGNDARLSDARTPLAHTHPQSDVTNLVTDLGGKEPANANIQTHVAQAHAPSDAQKNSDITKAEIEAKLTGEISSHTHAGGGLHATTHEFGGSDEINVSELSGTLADAQYPVIGPSGGEAVAGNDARLTDARTPLAHAHVAADITGTAVLTADSRLSDTRVPTTHDILTKHNGFPGGTSTFLRADGTFAAPPAGGGGQVGIATLNFGTRTTPQKFAQVDVTGLAGLSDTTPMRAFMQGATTADHSIDEHMVEDIELRMKYLTATTARITGQVARGKAWGNFTIQYAA